MSQLSSEVAEESRSREWLLISEVFSSHQGEGPSCGELSGFVRLGGCGLACVYCDTPYTWVYTERQQELHQEHKLYDPKEQLGRLHIASLANEILDMKANLIVITGGEPLLQINQVAKLISTVNESLVWKRFEIETAGVIVPDKLLTFENVKFNVSLKLASSGNADSKRLVPSAIEKFAAVGGRFKFVICRNTFQQDIAEVAQLQQHYRIPPENVWVMPEGVTQLDQVSGIQRLMPVALERSWNVTTRLHVLGYGNERGI
jgi:7-carboxy-7-deazaguanine synthase